LDHGFGELNKDSVVKLAETQQLQDLANLGADTVDTSDSDDNGDLCFIGNVEGTTVASNAFEANFVGFKTFVLSGVLLGTFEDVSASNPVGLGDLSSCLDSFDLLLLGCLLGFNLCLRNRNSFGTWFGSLNTLC